MNRNYNKKINTEYLKDNFGNNLKKALKTKNITKEKIAEIMDVDPRSVAYWTDGIKFPRLEKIVRICEVLDVTLDNLVRD